MALKGVLFDLDGTLMDTLGDLADSVNAALSAQGLPPHPELAYKRFVGDGMTELVRRAFPAAALAGDGLARAQEAVRAEYERRWDVRSRPYPGVTDLLAVLELHGVPMAVFSNKPDGFTKRIVERFLSRFRFVSVLGARPGVPLKPDPAGALEAARLLGLAPAEVAYLGDTATDMATAAAAGMEPLGALWGFRDAAELMEAGARHLIARPEGLVPLLS